MTVDVSEKVRSIIAEQVEMDVAQVIPTSTPSELKIDSLRMVDIIFALEEEFDVTIPFNANDPGGSGFKMDQVGDVISFMETLVAENQ